MFTFSLERLLEFREAEPIPPNEYESLISRILPPMLACIGAIKSSDPASLTSQLDYFAKEVIHWGEIPRASRH